MKTRTDSLAALAIGAMLLLGSPIDTARAQSGPTFGYDRATGDSSWSEIRSDFGSATPHRDDFQVYMEEPFASLPNLRPDAYFDVVAPEPSTAALLALAIPLLVPLKFLRRKLAVSPVKINVPPISERSRQGS